MSADNSLRPLVEQMFKDLDADASGLLDIDEVRELTKSLGMALDEAQLAQMMEAIDTDSSGLIDFDEFFSFYVTTVVSPEAYY